MNEKLKFGLGMAEIRKHCEKRRKCWLPAFSPFPIMFSKAVKSIVRKGEIACKKRFLLFSQCFLPYMALIFQFKCPLKCLQFVSIWTSLKFCRLVMG